MERQGGGLIVGVTLAGLVVVVALPLSFVFLQAVFPDLPSGSFARPFAAAMTAFGDDRLIRLVLNTVALGLAVAIGTIVVALPFAVLRGLADPPAPALWDVLFLIPFMIPPYIGAFAWILTLQPAGFASQLAGVHAGPLVFSFWGIAAVMTLHLFPVVYFALSRTLAVVGGHLGDVGRVCGATPLRAFLRITLPLATPGLAASLLLVFALSIEEFGTPAALGGHAGFHVLVTGIHERFADFPIDLPGAAVLSTILVALALGAFVLQNWIVTRRSFVAVEGKPSREVVFSLGRWRWLAALPFAAVTVLAVIVPVGAVILAAVTETMSGGLALSNVGLRHFREVFANESGALSALGNSVSLAAGAALCAGLLGALVAFITVRTTLPARRAVDALSLLPNALPGMVVAVGLILAWNQSWWPVTVYNTAFVLLLAYVCLLLPYPVRYVAAGLRQIGPSLDAAARVSGAGFGRTLRHILAPLVAPHLLIAMGLVFAIASRELVSSIMLAPPGVQTVATFVYRQFEQGSPGIGMAMSVIAIFTSIAILVALNRLYRQIAAGG